MSVHSSSTWNHSSGFLDFYDLNHFEDYGPVILKYVPQFRFVSGFLKIRFNLGITGRNITEIMLDSSPHTQSRHCDCHWTIAVDVNSNNLMKIVSARLFHSKLFLFSPYSMYFEKRCFEIL